MRRIPSLMSHLACSSSASYPRCGAAVSYKHVYCIRLVTCQHVPGPTRLNPLGAGVPGIRVGSSSSRPSPRRGVRAQRMARAGVPDQHGLFLHAVAALAVGFTRVDRVFEVEAAADGEAFDKFVAHS